MGEDTVRLLGTARHDVWLARGLTVAALVWCFLVFGGHALAGAFSCSWDTSYCASSYKKDGFYTGVLRDSHRQPYRDTEFSVFFESSSGDRVAGFKTDDDGRFCLRWSQESITPAIYIEERRKDLNHWHKANGSVVPPDCQSRGRIEWSSAEDGTSSPQYKSTFVVIAIAALLILIGAVATRFRYRKEVWISGLSTAVVATLMAVIL